VQLGWYDVAPVRNGIEWRYVADLEAKDYPQSGIIVGAAGFVDLLGCERIKRKHILHSGDSTTNAFDSAEQCSQPDLMAAARRIGARQSVERPKFQYRWIKAALEKDRANDNVR
jgi:hypothetical protein